MSEDPIHRSALKHSRKKHAFILTSAGKPIFSNFPHEEEIVNTFSFLQAVISVVSSSGDEIKSMSVNTSKIVFCFRKHLYFIIVSDFDEPESILYRQLEFFYQYILFILTAKVHDLIHNNPSIDLTNLLGSDADRILLSAGCNTHLTPPPIAFNALEQILIDKAVREDIHTSLKDCVEKCGAAAGLLIQDGMLISNQQGSSSGLSLSIGDALLLTNFVNQSQSLKTNEQNWIPICLPEFNSNGYLQAYVASLNVDLDKHGICCFMLVLIAQPQDLQNLIKGKNYLQKLMSIVPTAPRLQTIFDQHQIAINRLREETNCIHFCFRYTTLLARVGGLSSASSNKLLETLNSSANKSTEFAYFVHSGEDTDKRLLSGYGNDKSNSRPAPLDASKSNGPYPNQQPGRVSSTLESIWIAYEQLALRLRRATTLYEVLGQPPVAGIASSGKSTGAGSETRGRSLSLLGGSTTPTVNNSTTGTGNSEDGVSDPLAEPTCSDHALSVMTVNGMTFLGLASFGCELYVAFPDTMPLQDATRLTDQLCQMLKTFVI